MMEAGGSLIPSLSPALVYLTFAWVKGQSLIYVSVGERLGTRLGWRQQTMYSAYFYCTVPLPYTNGKSLGNNMYSYMHA